MCIKGPQNIFMKVKTTISAAAPHPKKAEVYALKEAIIWPFFSNAKLLIASLDNREWT
jgi:hypothetical protein